MSKKSEKKILLVEDDEYYRSALYDLLEERFEVFESESAEEAHSFLNEQSVDLMLVDINLPGMNGVDLLQEVKKAGNDVQVIMLTARDSVPLVVDAIKMGAADYLTKPIEPDQLLVIIERAFESMDHKRELEQHRNLQLAANKEYKLLGVSEQLRKIRKIIEVVAKTDSPVLIEGQTGTGKELIAREIHTASPRANKPFVAINCGAIPKEIIESELFGHKKGAFTGARKDEIGKFQLADKGTLLLDEIAEIPLESQTKLLRVLEQREFYPVGSNKLVRVNTRAIAATNKNLQELVAKGEFREDLFYRLNAYTIHLPPLHQRPDDILALTEHFLKVFNVKFGKKFKDISPAAKDYLLEYSWKGNVRELRNVIERIVLFEDGDTVERAHLNFLSHPKQSHHTASRQFDDFPADGIDKALEETEKQYLKAALERTKGRKNEAAKLLKLSLPTFYYRLEKYGIEA